MIGVLPAKGGPVVDCHYLPQCKKKKFSPVKKVRQQTAYKSPCDVTVESQAPMLAKWLRV